jgi:polyhydroxybutyrate depolymerase
MAERQLVDFSHAGLRRPYLLQRAADAHESAPLVIELHGRGIDPVRFDELWTGFGELAARKGFALALPSAEREIWNDGRHPTLGLPNDVAYLQAVLADVRMRLAIDPARIYAVGMSNGASMIGRLLCEGIGPVAAVAQVSGTIGADLAARCEWDTPIPVLQIHGTDDRVNPYAGGTATGLIQRLVMVGRPRSRPVLGVEAWARLCVAANRAVEPPEMGRPEGGVSTRTWRGRSPRSDVVFASVDGGGHTWPGSRTYVPRLLLGNVNRNFDATAVIWDFFAAHPRHE